MVRYSQNLAVQAGVTVIELLVVITIIAIIAGFAMMQRGSANEQFQRQNVARELKVAFERARFDSVKRRGEAAAAPTNDTRARVVVTATSFTLVTDNNGNGDLVNDDATFDSADAVTTTVAVGIVIDGSGVTLPATVYFDRRGEITVESSGGSSPIFLVCNVSCSSPNGSNANIVLVTSTGTVNLLPGGWPTPDFGVPTMTNVSTTTGINNDAIVAP